MENTSEKALRHGYTRDALYKARKRNAPPIDAIIADVQEMQSILAELGIELRSPAEIHTSIRIPAPDQKAWLWEWVERLTKSNGLLTVSTTNAAIHRMAAFITIAQENCLTVTAQPGEDEDGHYIHLSAVEKNFVIL